MPGTRVAIYARISEDRSGEGIGVGRQVADCTDLATKRGLDVVKVIEENDTSAYGRKPRPGWNVLVEMARRHEIDGIVTWHTDRLYRHPRDLEQIIEVVESNRLDIYTVMSGDLDLSTSSGRMVARMLGAAARAEVERTSDRIVRANRQKAEQGGWKGGRRPWGYEANGVEVYEIEARAIREAAQMVLAGYTLTAAARMFNELTEESKYRQQDQRSMSRKVLRDILISYRIAGKRQHVTQQVRDQFAKRRRESERPIPEPWRQTSYVDAQWAAILDEETWRALRAKLLDPIQLAGRARRPQKSMLGGLLKCGECYKETDPITGDPIMASLGYGAKSYTCIRCGKVGISIDAVERLITAKVSEVLEALPQDLPDVRGLDPADQVPEWMSRREQLEESERRLTNAMIDGVLSEAAYRDGLDRIKTDRESITRQEDAAHLRVVRRRQVKQLLPTWQKANAVEKGAVIAQAAEYFLVERVARSGQTFQPGRVLARWYDRDELARLGPAPIPADETENRTEERRKEMTRERHRRHRAKSKRWTV